MWLNPYTSMVSLSVGLLPLNIVMFNYIFCRSPVGEKSGHYHAKDGGSVEVST